MDVNPVTIQDIATHATVSKSTVSRVTNNTTPVNAAKRTPVLDAVEPLNFQPNRLVSGLAGGQSMTIGVQSQKMGSPFYDSITRGIIQSLSPSRYSPIFVDGRWEPELQAGGFETLLRRQVDGLIIVGGSLSRQQVEIAMGQKPVLIVGREINGLEDHCMCIDNFDAAYRATQYLIGLGHRKIVHIAGIKDQQDADQKLKGYRFALDEADIAFDPGLVVEGQFDGPSGVSAVELLLNQGKEFTAIFAANDRMALGARLALYHHGIDVPREVSLIGFDDQVEAAFMTPPLTTVRQPALELGISVGKAMLNVLNNEPYSLTTLPCEIQIRESTATIG